MNHWADRYVGLPFKERGRGRDGVDCWGLVRLVLAERCGLILPRWDGLGDIKETVAREAVAFDDIEIDKTQEFDAVMMNLEVRSGLGWTMAPVHIGVVVSPRQVLHIREGLLSCIEPFERLRIAGAKRNPINAR